jgi:hypothetical protein
VCRRENDRPSECPTGSDLSRLQHCHLLHISTLLSTRVHKTFHGVKDQARYVYTVSEAPPVQMQLGNGVEDVYSGMNVPVFIMTCVVARPTVFLKPTTGFSQLLSGPCVSVHKREGKASTSRHGVLTAFHEGVFEAQDKQLTGPRHVGCSLWITFRGINSSDMLDQVLFTQIDSVELKMRSRHWAWRLNIGGG